MHSAKLLFSLCLFVIWSQYVESKVANDLKSTTEIISPTALIVTRNKNHLLSLKDVWKKVKNTIMNAWNYVKVLANNAKTTRNIWMQHVKKQSEEVKKAFEDRLKNLHHNLFDIINKVFGNSGVVKQCIKQETGAVEKSLNDIIQGMSSCLRTHLEIHPILRSGLEPIELNDTKFFEEFETKLSFCEKEPENYETCLYEVREDAFGDIEGIETNLYRNQIASRSLVDNLQDALVTCSIDGLLEASSAVATEALEITKCVIEGSKNKTE